MFDLSACDFEKSSNGKLKILSNHRKGNSSALLDVLKIGLEDRGMLMRNLDVDHDLVNGVFGTVKRFLENNGKITGIYVKSEHDPEGRGPAVPIAANLPPNAVLVTRVEEPLQTQRNSNISNLVRRQIPLKLGWAATIHKTQCMSITQLVYDMSDTFAAGMGYVALNQVVSLQGLYLKGYSPNVICRDEQIFRAVAALSKLDVNVGCHFGDESRQQIIVHYVQGLRSKLEDSEATYLKLRV